jgi:hypothetical protein
MVAEILARQFALIQIKKTAVSEPLSTSFDLALA